MDRVGTLYAMVLAGDGTFLVHPHVGAWLLVTLGFFVLAGTITVAKGRWGWLLVGLAFGGAIWPLTALLRAKPDSPWGRAFYGPDKMARARKLFSRRLPYAQQ